MKEAAIWDDVGCIPGFYGNTDSLHPKVCTQCMPGRYKEGFGMQSSCTDCPMGSYSRDYGNTQTRTNTQLHELNIYIGYMTQQ